MFVGAAFQTNKSPNHVGCLRSEPRMQSGPRQRYYLSLWLYIFNHLFMYFLLFSWCLCTSHIHHFLSSFVFHIIKALFFRKPVLAVKDIQILGINFEQKYTSVQWIVISKCYRGLNWCLLFYLNQRVKYPNQLESFGFRI